MNLLVSDDTYEKKLDNHYSKVFAATAHCYQNISVALYVLTRKSP